MTIHSDALHGDYQLYLLDDLLIASAQGPWNQPLCHNFCNDFMALGESLQQPWAHIVLLDQWELAVPEAEQEISQLQQWCIQKGMSHVAQVFSFSPLKAFQLERMLPEEHCYQKRVFKEVASAAEWLGQQGFNSANQLTLSGDKPAMIQRHFDFVA